MIRYKTVASKKKSGLRTANQKDHQVKVEINSNDFLLSQTTICSSVVTEGGGYKIKPEASIFVNSNGEGWTNESLRANYKSFIGAWNYVDHIQIPDKSVGFIADAVLRRRYLDEEKGLFVYYVDILVATSRDHEELVKKISLGKIKYLSMGCTTFESTCSRCGHVVTEDAMGEPVYCEHLDYQKGKKYFDDQGVQRRVCELLGNENPNSCVFEEASWLTMPPAFGGAVMRNLLPVPKDHSIFIEIPESSLDRPAMKKYLD